MFLYPGIADLSNCSSIFVYIVLCRTLRNIARGAALCIRLPCVLCMELGRSGRFVVVVPVRMLRHVDEYITRWEIAKSLLVNQLCSKYFNLVWLDCQSLCS